MFQRLLALAICLISIIALSAAVHDTGSDESQPDSYLSITVTGSYSGLVLVDPVGSVSVITPAGRESTFSGCQRVDVPEVGGVPDSLDYTRFYVREPRSGSYRLTMTATKPAPIRVALVVSWSGLGRRHSVGDDAALAAMPADDVVCTVVVRRRISPDRHALSARISELRTRRAQAEHSSGREP